jgi:Bifunctional DNA primase/polymerase, N-terminal
VVKVIDDLEALLRTAIDAADIAELERIAALMDAEDDRRRARLASPEALKDAALWYASVGIAVFPLRPLDKRPHPYTSGFKDATTDQSRIASWWHQWPGSNIGAPTGVTFDVIDIDGELGIRSVIDNRLEFTNRIGRSATSRDGGTHVFIPPQGRGNGAALFPGIDYRGHGGYVVLPPSVGANGRRYTWLQPLEVSGA